MIGIGALDGRVAVITGAGRGLGREHALLFAEEGAKVVVNDLGGGPEGTGEDRSVAQQVVDEIKANGGEAVANTDSVTSWEGAQRLVNTALEAFGELHVLVNNAGILRDRMIVNMTEEEWDAVLSVHLKGTFNATRHAAAYWREQSKAGKVLKPALVCTSSGSGLYNNLGQTNYAAAKAAIVAFTLTCAKELQAYGVRANVVAPSARTRLTLQTPGLAEQISAPEDPDKFDIWDPANVSPLVAYLSAAECPFSGTVFHIHAGTIAVLQGWTILEKLENEKRWTISDIEVEAKRVLAANPEKQGFLLSEASVMSELFQIE